MLICIHPIASFNDDSKLFSFSCLVLSFTFLSSCNTHSHTHKMQIFLWQNCKRSTTQTTRNASRTERMWIAREQLIRNDIRQHKAMTPSRIHTVWHCVTCTICTMYRTTGRQWFWRRQCVNHITRDEKIHKIDAYKSNDERCSCPLYSREFAFFLLSSRLTDDCGETFILMLAAQIINFIHIYIFHNMCTIIRTNSMWNQFRQSQPKKKWKKGNHMTATSAATAATHWNEWQTVTKVRVY